MNSLIVFPLCVVSWIFTLVRLRAILRQGMQDAGTITLHIWGMLLFFAITLTFMIPEFTTFFDAHTIPSLSLFITNSAFLVSQYLGMAGILIGMEIPTAPQIIRWIRLLFGIVLAVLFVIYIFVEKVQYVSFFAPKSLPEAWFIVVVCSFATLMCIVLVTIQLIYFPAKKFALLRLRTTLMMLCISTSAIFLLIRVFTFGSYIWQFSLSPMLVPVAYVLLICATLLFFTMFLSDRLYARFVVMSRNIENWRAFQDLKYLVEHLMLLCPVIGLPAGNPSFWRFLFKSEYHLYCSIIIILDSKIMLADFLDECMKPGTMPLWEGDLLQEAIRINDALQQAKPSNDFADIVETYRRVSRDLFVSQKDVPTGVF